MGEVHRHRGSFASASRRDAASDEQQLGAAGVDSPAARGDRAKSPKGYVVSLVRLHERGFSVPVSRFMRALC